MNALAKSCSALRVMASNGEKNNQSKYHDHGNNERRQPRYDPAREAEVMLESMIEKHAELLLGGFMREWR